MSLPRFCATSLGVLGVALCAPPLRAQSAPDPPPVAEPPRLNDSAELARVVSLYEAGKYGECADSLHLLLSDDSSRPLHDPDVIESARIYHAACLIGIGSPQLADEPLRAAIRQSPQMKPPDSLVFPPQVIDRFLRVRETMFDVIRKAEDERVKMAQEQAAQQEDKARKERQRVAGLERLAQQETLVARRTRWLAFVPFGVGQFQNGDASLGYAFLTSEALLAASTMLTLGIETHLVLRANELSTGPNKPAPSINTTLADWHTGLEYASYAWLGVTVIGIVEAQIAFLPEHSGVRKRPLPVELRPAASVTPSGAVLGVTGRF